MEPELKKIAIFVEGQTERIFVEKFLIEYFGYNKIELDNQKYLGKKGIRLLGKKKNPYAEFYVLIFDVGGDGTVVTALKERAESMIDNSGYSYILALQDLFPRKRDETKIVIETFKKIFQDSLFAQQLKLILAIMEIEAWFLADYNLFSRIFPLATNELIKDKIGIDLIRDNPESYLHPSYIIDQIYNIFGERYKKREKQSYQIVHNIDFPFLICAEQVLNKVSSFKYFIDCIDKSFV